MKPAETGVKRVRSPRALLWSVPVGLQLSLVYALLFTTVLALLGWALYGQLESFLVKNTAERIDRITQPVLVRAFPTRREPRPDERIPLPLPQSSEEQAAAYLVRELSRSDVAVAVLDASGETILSTTPTSSSDELSIPALPVNLASQVESSAVAEPVQWIATGASGERMLVILTPLAIVPSDGSATTPIYLQQVTSLSAADAVLNQLRFYIVLGIVLGTAIGVVAGLMLTRATLRPLERMVGTAEAISAGDLSRRLRLPPGRNEVARLGSAFDHMVDRLAATLQAQRRFIADASHELRTPLTSLEGMSEMLLIGADRGDTRTVQRIVRSVHSELGRMRRLVADLLTLSRLDSSAPMQPAVVDASELLKEVAEQVAPLAESKEVALHARGETPATVRGDPDRLKQVFLNLVDNALRYTPAGGRVWLSAATDPTHSRVRIEVQDTGPGIAPEDLPRIFDRFYRGDPSRARSSGNTGLGLAIARAIVEAHDGTIEAESRPGEGARFVVTLPAAQRQGKDAAGAAPHRPLVGRQARSSQPQEAPLAER